MRLFVGIELPQDAKRELVARQCELRRIAVGRWKREENMHLTIRFIGEVGQAQLEKLCMSLNQTAESVCPFILKLGPTGFFGMSREIIRVVWTGIEGDVKELLHLKSAIDSALAENGIMAEKRLYHPHITLAQDVRLNPGKEIVISSASTVDFQVDRFDLILSTEETRRRVYASLHQVQFIKRME